MIADLKAEGVALVVIVQTTISNGRRRAYENQNVRKNTRHPFQPQPNRGRATGRRSQAHFICGGDAGGAGMCRHGGRERQLYTEVGQRWFRRRRVLRSQWPGGGLV